MPRIGPEREPTRSGLRSTNGMSDNTPAPDPMAQFMRMIEILTEKLDERRQTSPSPAGESRKEPRAKDPELFKGQRNKLTEFLTECRINFELQKSRFPDESTKVHFAISFLRETPLLAVQPHIANGPGSYPEFLQTFDSFADYLRRSYGDPDERGTAKRKLRGLVQTGAASDYFAEFNHHAAVLGWKDEEPIIEQAMYGLKDHLKDEIARSGKDFTTLSDLMDFIIPLDNRLWEREIERKSKTTTTAKVSITAPVTHNFAPTVPKMGGTMANPATVVRTSITAPNLATNNPFRGGSARPVIPRGPLSEEEKARRRANNECTYCGEQGHYVAVCPRLERNNARFSAPQQGPPIRTEIADHPAKNGDSSTM